MVLEHSLCFSGIYSLNVEASGFKKQLGIDIKIDVSKKCGMNLMIEVGYITQIVPVAV